MATSLQLRHVLNDAHRRSGAGIVVVDLARLQFIDSTGLSELHRASGFANRRHPLTIVSAPDHALRLLRITGLDQVLDIRSDPGHLRGH